MSDRFAPRALRAVAVAVAVAVAIVLAVSSQSRADVPDNGSGTAHMPIRDTYVQVTPMQISNGLPPASTIDCSGVLTTPTDTAEIAGGTLGGTKAAAGTGLGFQWSMQGTGAMAAYNRNLFLPLGTASVASFPTTFNAGIEVHTAPRTAFAPVQSFDTDLNRLFGQITSDPDFDLLRVVAGTDFGLPSPGHTTLVQSGPNWAVDSFFDVVYRIDFVGAPGGPFGGMSGSSTSTVRIVIPEPATGAMLIAPFACATLRRSRRAANVQ
jgi:hypothetical protein